VNRYWIAGSGKWRQVNVINQIFQYSSVKLHNEGRHAKQATEEQADGFEAELLLAVVARITLT
jgi:hypothetical protein